MKVYKTSAGDYSLVMQFGTDDYRLFQNFLAHTSKTLPDVRTKQLFERMFAAYQTPQEQADMAKPSIDAGFSNQVTGKMEVISQKIDSVIRAIGGLDSSKPVSVAQIDLSGIEGLIAKLEKTLANQVGSKIEATQGTVINDLRGGLEATVRSEISSIKTLLLQMQQSLQSSVKQLDSVSVVQPADVMVSAVTMQTTVEEPVKIGPVKQVEPLPVKQEPTIVVGEDIVRYPASKKKGAVPKCYGNSLPAKSKEERSPCQSCVWVNECSLKEAVPQSSKPECYGKYDAGLKCTSCSEVSKCMQEK